MARRLKAIDFFCGGGGMTCGLQQAGVQVIAGVDLDVECKETYESNNSGSKFVLADVKELPLDYFEREFSVQRHDESLILVGCSPCQYYSIINTKRTKSSGSKGLLLDFMRFVDYYRPGIVLVENVPGIVSNKDSVLPEFISFMENSGYISTYKVIDMSHYGIPQSRKRFSLIASRIGNPPKLPVADEKRLTVQDVIGATNGFSKIDAGTIDLSPFRHSASGLSPICLERLKKTPKNGGSRMSWKDDSQLQLNCFIGKDNSFKDTFGRLWWDRPASTITTKFFNISCGRFAHPEEDRAISIREGATLQTFPKTYDFKVRSTATAARLIGNAVPPEYARRLGETIKGLVKS